MTNLTAKIDRAMIYLIVAMLAFMCSLFFAKFNLSPAAVRNAVLENREIIEEVLIGQKRIIEILEQSTNDKR